MNFLILGIPNVGKTSLYNIITNSSQNIIHKTYGTTRDWHALPLKVNSNIYIYDTPGITFRKNSIDKFYKNLINIIDVFIYVIDYKSENQINDKELINLLRKYNKEIIFVVNKDDNLNQDKDLNEFGLKNIFYTSCSHKLGIDKLLNFLSKYQVDDVTKTKINFTIGLFGKTNVGKSTLMNKLVGYDRSIVSNKPKTTTDIVVSSYKYKGNNYLINDTAGLLKKNKIDRESLDYYSTKKTLSIVKDIDLNIFLIDFQQGFDTQSKKIFNLIYKQSNIFLFLINKIDLIKNNKRKILNELKKDIVSSSSQTKNIFIVPISTFNLKDINYLKNYIHKLSFEVKKNISTSKINLWLQKTTNKNPHSRVKGKEVRFKYATQIIDNPLTIKIFGNYSREINSHYRRFLINSFCEYFKIKSKNLKIIFSKTNNPYQ